MAHQGRWSLEREGRGFVEKHSRWWSARLDSSSGTRGDALQSRRRRAAPRTRRVFERLRDHVARRAISLQFNDHRVPLAVHADEVDESPEVGSDLAPDDQDPPIFENPVGIGLQPLLEDRFFMLDLDRQPLVLGEPAVRPNAEDSHGRHAIVSIKGERLSDGDRDKSVWQPARRPIPVAAGRLVVVARRSRPFVLRKARGRGASEGQRTGRSVRRNSDRHCRGASAGVHGACIVMRASTREEMRRILHEPFGCSRSTPGKGRVRTSASFKPTVFPRAFRVQ